MVQFQQVLLVLEIHILFKPPFQESHQNSPKYKNIYISSEGGGFATTLPGGKEDIKDEETGGSGCWGVRGEVAQGGRISKLNYIAEIDVVLLHQPL